MKRRAAEASGDEPKKASTMPKRQRKALAAASEAPKASNQRKRRTESVETSINSMDSVFEASKVVDLAEEEVNLEELEAEAVAAEEEEKMVERGDEVVQQKRRVGVSKEKREDDDCCLFGKPVPLEEAKQRWPHRYQASRKYDSVTRKEVDDEVVKAKCHYLQAKVDGIIYDLYDNAYVKANEGEDDYIGRIIELFETHDNQLYFTAQWFFRAKDTVIKDQTLSHDDRRVFISTEKDDNVLDCLVSKVQIVQIDMLSEVEKSPPCDLYYDMSYSPKFCTFANISQEEVKIGIETLSSSLSSEGDSNMSKDMSECNSVVSLLDLYSGCGAMSTGLCHGARLSGVNLQTCWAVDLNSYACESLKLNHPTTEVRNEKAEDFLSLLHEWEKLCSDYGILQNKSPVDDDLDLENDEESEDSSSLSPGEFEVGKIVGICYGETENLESVGLKFKVRWKGYGPSDDTWEPAEGLSNCQERIRNFVRFGYKNNILPLPGRVDVICGGPPCQGISGFNRFRNVKAPLEDPKNKQLVVFMDIVEYLKPKYVLMENVVDILKFAGGQLGRYAFSRLLAMNYQSRLGILAAGSFGLPQFRLRAFLWGALRTQKLPQFPLPTHDVVVRGGIPNEFESNAVHCKTEERPIKKALLLKDAISDLPLVANDEKRDEMDYTKSPDTEFQSFIRRAQHGDNLCQNLKLFDHRPLKLKEDDYLRVCQVPKMKGANFRNLAGVLVGPDNVVYLDPSIERPKLPSGKPLVPDYAITFVKGKSLKPFGRLWWDETIATVVTRAEPHNQAVVHPVQDRVLTIRENARLQGFPDYYKLCGPVKERYIQVGNAVAVPVSRALGYAMGLAFQGKCISEEPTLELPPKFPDMEVSCSDVDAV